MTTHVCKHCRQVFTVAKSNGYPTRQFCGHACRAAAQRAARPSFTCRTCGKVFSIPAAWARKPGGGHYCSRACHGAARRG